MQLVLTGTIDTIFPSEVKGNFEKRLMWLKENDAAKPNVWQVQFDNNDGEILDKFKPGQSVICQIELKGFKWIKNGTTNVFNTLKCTMIKHFV